MIKPLHAFKISITENGTRRTLYANAATSIDALLYVMTNVDNCFGCRVVVRPA